MEASACRDGDLQSPADKMGTTPQHFHTIPTSCPFLTCIVCVQKKVVEDTGLGSAHECVVHADVHGE